MEDIIKNMENEMTNIQTQIEYDKKRKEANLDREQRQITDAEKHKQTILADITQIQNIQKTLNDEDLQETPQAHAADEDLVKIGSKVSKIIDDEKKAFAEFK